MLCQGSLAVSVVAVAVGVVIGTGCGAGSAPLGEEEHPDLTIPGTRWTYEAISPENDSAAQGCGLIRYTVESSLGDGSFLTSVSCLGGLPVLNMETQQIRDGYAFFHAPRLGPFRKLEAAPFPTALGPGRLEFSQTIHPGPSWRSVAPDTVVQKIVFDGEEEVSVPAGTFSHARRFLGSTPGWTASFWWSDTAGFVRMRFVARDGETFEFRLVKLELPNGAP